MKIIKNIDNVNYKATRFSVYDFVMFYIILPLGLLLKIYFNEKQEPLYFLTVYVITVLFLSLILIFRNLIHYNSYYLYDSYLRVSNESVIFKKEVVINFSEIKSVEIKTFGSGSANSVITFFTDKKKIKVSTFLFDCNDILLIGSEILKKCPVIKSTKYYNNELIMDVPPKTKVWR